MKLRIIKFIEEEILFKIKLIKMNFKIFKILTNLILHKINLTNLTKNFQELFQIKNNFNFVWHLKIIKKNKILNQT